MDFRFINIVPRVYKNKLLKAKQDLFIEDYSFAVMVMFYKTNKIIVKKKSGKKWVMSTPWEYYIDNVKLEKAKKEKAEAERKAKKEKKAKTIKLSPIEKDEL